MDTYFFVLSEKIWRNSRAADNGSRTWRPRLAELPPVKSVCFKAQVSSDALVNVAY